MANEDLEFNPFYLALQVKLIGYGRSTTSTVLYNLYYCTGANFCYTEFLNVFFHNVNKIVSHINDIMRHSFYYIFTSPHY